MLFFGSREDRKIRRKVREGVRALRQKRPEDAIAALREALEAAPDHPAALLNLGLAYHHSGQHTKAIEQFERLAEVTPADARPWVNVGASENALGHLDRAEAALLKALEIDPQQQGVHYNLAVIYLKRNEIPNAMAEMEVELAVNPGHRETIAAVEALRRRLLPR